MTTLLIRDEDLSTGKAIQEFSLDFLTEHITVRELIRSRVYQEVNDFNLRGSKGEFRGIIASANSERTATGYRMKTSRSIDWKEQFVLATQAFEQGRVLILVNDQQMQSLDEEITVAAQTVVTFVKLVLLVGG